jgi:hypothetical protein
LWGTFDRLLARKRIAGSTGTQHDDMDTHEQWAVAEQNQRPLEVTHGRKK